MKSLIALIAGSLVTVQASDAPAANEPSKSHRNGTKLLHIMMRDCLRRYWRRAGSTSLRHHTLRTVPRPQKRQWRFSRFRHPDRGHHPRWKQGWLPNTSARIGDTLAPAIQGSVIEQESGYSPPIQSTVID
jgi:hypothetical protein